MRESDTATTTLPPADPPRSTASTPSPNPLSTYRTVTGSRSSCKISIGVLIAFKMAFAFLSAFVGGVLQRGEDGEEESGGHGKDAALVPGHKHFARQVQAGDR